MLNSEVGAVTPIPTFLEKYALPVVVAPPYIVRPPACVPFPIVDDAKTPIPTVVVGVRYPFVRVHAFPKFKPSVFPVNVKGEAIFTPCTVPFEFVESNWDERDEIAREVVVAFVVVALVAVRADAVMEFTTAVVMLARVVKKFVEVALVVVELTAVKF